MKSVKKYSPETRGRAVRLVFEQERGHSSQWGARQWEMPRSDDGRTGAGEGVGAREP